MKTSALPSRHRDRKADFNSENTNTRGKAGSSAVPAPNWSHPWPCCGSAVDHLWVSCGSPMGQLWMSCGWAVDELWISYGSPVDQLWMLGARAASLVSTTQPCNAHIPVELIYSLPQCVKLGSEKQGESRNQSPCSGCGALNPQGEGGRHHLSPAAKHHPFPRTQWKQQEHCERNLH